jgi:RNA methyltransferase, TrmH family
MKNITSSKNPAFKLVKSLNERKYRENNEMFYIEGTRFVNEALKEGVQFNKLFLSESFSISKMSSDLEVFIHGNSEVYILPDKMFNEICDTENPQGILAVIGMRKYHLQDLVDDKGFVVVLDAIRDPGNMGTILRTADAAGVSGVLISKGSVDVYNSKVLRSTMGSIFRLPIVFSDDIADDINTLKKYGFRILATHLQGKENYFDVSLKEKIGLVIGNEAFGVSQSISESADSLVKIPMPGKAESLNASVAAGILIFEAVRQRIR